MFRNLFSLMSYILFNKAGIGENKVSVIRRESLNVYLIANLFCVPESEFIDRVMLPQYTCYCTVNN